MTDVEQRLVALGNAVRALREERELTADALATAAGIDPVRLASLEAGRFDPDFDLLLRVAHALGTGVATIVIRAERETS
jgi:transcriptional regulator with XRE-family HTH domain